MVWKGLDAVAGLGGGGWKAGLAEWSGHDGMSAEDVA